MGGFNPFKFLIEPFKIIVRLFKLIIDIVININTVITNILDIIISIPIYMVLLILGWLIEFWFRVAISTVGTLVMFIITDLLAFAAIFVYAWVTVLSIPLAIVDMIFLGHISPIIRRVFACSRIPTNWYDVKYSHVGNKHDKKRIAGTCVGCARPCPSSSMPKKSNTGSITCVKANGSSYIKPYTPCAAMMNILKGKYVFPSDVEVDVYNHVDMLPLAKAICKYIEHIENKVANHTRIIGSNVFKSETDVVARAYNTSALDMLMNMTSSPMVNVTLLLFIGTIMTLSAMALYSMLTGGVNF